MAEREQTSDQKETPGFLYPERIDFPRQAESYFRKHGTFLDNLPSYADIEGKLPNRPKLPYDSELFPIKNADSKDHAVADEQSLRLFRMFLGIEIRAISEVNRGYMLTGDTKPIRVDASIWKKQASIYVKKPSIERIFGLSMYNLLSGLRDQNYMFNREVFVENSISGEQATNLSLEDLSKRPKFKESLIRLDTLDRLLSIFNDIKIDEESMNGLDNFMILADGTCVAFDFHVAFMPGISVIPGILAKKFRALGMDLSEDMEKMVSSDEARKINHRIYDNKKRFWGVVDLMDKVPYIKNIFGFSGYKSARDYFIDKVSGLCKLI